jgi:hypothetical protein
VTITVTMVCDETHLSPGIVTARNRMDMGSVAQRDDCDAHDDEMQGFTKRGCGTLFPERIGGRPEASEYNPDETINKAIYHGQPMDK